MKLKHCKKCGWLEDHEIQEPCDECPTCGAYTKLVQPYGIWCVRLPSSVFGYSEAWMKEKDSIALYPDKTSAVLKAAELNLEKGIAKVYYRAKSFPCG